jgi:hypothetical protein
MGTKLVCISGGRSCRGAADNDEEREEQSGDTCDGEEEEEEEELDKVTAPCNHRVWYSTNHYIQADPVCERVQFKTHYEKVGREVLCDQTVLNLSV